jgi:hypothetical protein
MASDSSNAMCSLHDNEHAATWRCEDAECEEFQLMCEEMAAMHRKMPTTRKHQLTPLQITAPSPTARQAGSAKSLPKCLEHDRPFHLYDRTCEKLLCAEKCQFTDEHLQCVKVPLLTEKEQCLDGDDDFKNLCAELDVSQMLSKTGEFHTKSSRVHDSLETSKRNALELLEKRHLKVSLYI